VLHTRNGRISEQLARLAPPAGTAPRRTTLKALPAPAQVRSGAAPEFPAEEFDFWNDYGGFARGGREYVVRLRHGERTPHPWINVVARPSFGFHVSAGGSAFTWSQNSRDYQVTPWSNDPVINRPGEAILIRNVETGQVASPFAALSDDPVAIHEARHGTGRSTFRVWTDWVEAEAILLLAADAPARLSRVTVRNRSAASLRVEVVSYAELVLGNDRGRSASVIRARLDTALNALVARNPYATEIRGRATFLVADRPFGATTVARSAFLGTEGNLKRPAGLARWPEPLDDGDPCLAAKVALTLSAGGSETVTFVLGDTEEADLVKVIDGLRRPDAFEAAAKAADVLWDGFLGSLQVQTPDARLDRLVNTWLPYQALSCRLNGRSGFYQASGAYGFRDQLQDASALLLHDPGLLRAQLLNAAARQFPEGDVQHWWLPRTGAGVRTLISDDVVWLAHIAARYVEATGDASLMDETLPFVTGAALQPGQHDAFFSPKRTKRKVSVYEHCALALDLFMARTSERGLPLILGGDWNDGMNRVGVGGKGESVWLGWFGISTFDAFMPLARTRGDDERADRWAAHRDRLAAALEEHAWDGEWYRRASYDDGTPLGSRENDECRIDSIAQSWATISGAARPERARQAMDAALEQLADREGRLMRLFTPPFEATPHDPGYIKSYPPGVRENGGQYTHAAAWMVYALGRAGRGDEALDLFGLLNPISHAETRGDADRYRVEPYVAAADVYGVGEKAGRGGWTWYTGSAGWLYRAAVEGILGIELKDGKVRVAPNLPAGWPGFRATLVRNGVRTEVEVRREGGEVRVEVAENPSVPTRTD
jgi:cyclic beta-1,2-glucan synthetase